MILFSESLDLVAQLRDIHLLRKNLSILGFESLGVRLIFLMLVTDLLEDLVHAFEGEEPFDFGMNCVFILLFVLTVFGLILLDVLNKLSFEPIFKLEQVEEGVHGEDDGGCTSDGTKDRDTGI